jgi:hypothetical protein
MRFAAAILGAVAALKQAPAAPAQGANRPVQKVVKLLTEMKSNLEKEQKEDAELYEKMECWCKTNKDQKTKAVEEAEKKIADLEAAIEEYTARSSQLATEIKNLEADIKKNQKALAEATALREKELAEFQAEEKELMETIDSLTKAVSALGGVNGEFFLQTKSFVQLKQRLSAVPSKFQDVMRKDLWDMLGSLNESGDAQEKSPELAATQVFSDIFMAPRKALLQQEPGQTGGEGYEDVYDMTEKNRQDAEKAAAAEKEAALKGGAAKGAKSYNSRSGAIYGMLKQMNEDFQSKLATARTDEAEAQKLFEQMKAALLKEIAAQETSVKNKKTELAETNAANAQAKQDVEDTTNALGADEKFLVGLEEKCSTSSDEFNARQKERSDEIAAVGEALGMLTDDESRDLFGRTFNFVQVTSKTMSKAEHRIRESVAKTILASAKKTGNYHMAALAVSARLDGFEKVKKAMDEMLASLKAQQKDEYEHKEFCRVELDKNEDESRDKTHFKEDTESTITDLTGQIDTLTKEIEVLNVDIADTQVSIKAAGEDRAAENKEFQTTVADQRLTVNVLQKVLARLAEFYEKKDSGVVLKPSLLQQPNKPGQATGAPPKQAEYSEQGAAPGVMGLIQMIIADAKAMDAQVTKDEQKAQTEYAAFVTNANASVSAAQKSIASKTLEKAKAEESKSQEETTLQSTVNILATLASENADLHSACDFVVKNFDIRQEARAQEMDSIKSAKAVLSGASFSF